MEQERTSQKIGGTCALTDDAEESVPSENYDSIELAAHASCSTCTHSKQQHGACTRSSTDSARCVVAGHCSVPALGPNQPAGGLCAEIVRTL